MPDKILNEFEKKHRNNLVAISRNVKRIFNKTQSQALSIVDKMPNYGTGGKQFSFDDFPGAKKQVDQLMTRLHDNVNTEVVSGIKASYDLSEDKNNDMLDRLFAGSLKSLTDKQKQAYLDNRGTALEQFIKRKKGGLSLSDRVWRYTDQFKKEVETSVSAGLMDGTPATSMATDVKRYLREPNRTFRRVRDEYGNLKLSKAAKAYHPGRGVYRSSYKNAFRMTRTETNIAYRSADSDRWKKLDFVKGIHIETSHSHEIMDMCDMLAGDYPPDFKFTGWHPQCYDEETEVYTSRGWILFKDARIKDKVLSLNPESKELEWTNIVVAFGRPHKGKMYHFHNRSLDMLVTPEHKMVYLNKTSGELQNNKVAEDYKSTNGALYRAGKWEGEKPKFIKIGAHKFNVKHLAAFMGYYLSDGSSARKSQVFIAQEYSQINKENRIEISETIKGLGLKPKPTRAGVYVYDEALRSYLKPFGLSYEKHIPEWIKTADKETISTFLNAFISCDGSIREPKEFTGNRGNKFKTNNPERLYFTTSKRMADDIGELILKIGKRPSFYLDKTKGKNKEFKNGNYTINHDLWRIRECKSQTASVFKKDIVDYNGMVYDIQLEKNHILYTRRNGKCVWGSNCLCIATPILLSENEMTKHLKDGDLHTKGKQKKQRALPGNFKKYVAQNQMKFNQMRVKPFFVSDNEKLRASMVYRR